LRNNKEKTKKANAMRDPRHLKFRTLSTTLTIVVIVGVLLLNVVVGAVAERFPLSIDMSSDKVFTLSEESQAIAESIQKDVEVVVFADVEDYFIQLSQALYEMYLSYYGVEVDLSNQLERLSREIETSLAQLHTHSDGKISYTVIVPDQEPEKYAEYAKYNLGDNNLLFIRSYTPLATATQ
jgi:preprotein translocase subunit SecF